MQVALLKLVCKTPIVAVEAFMFYELRMYHAVPGRLAELVERIGKILPPFFERHGLWRPPRRTRSAGSRSHR